MNRREAIEKALLATGLTLSGPVLAALMKGCTARPGLTWPPQFLNEDQAHAVSELAEILIPQTDTPGAREAGVPGFIDELLKHIYTSDEQQKFIAGLTGIDAQAEAMHGKSFNGCTADEKHSLVKKLHDEALASIDRGGTDEWWNAATGKEMPFILQFKELVVAGYFTSEAGATRVLQYLPVPGPFKGCLPAEEVGRAWAT
jgi:hypothetical protein